MSEGEEGSKEEAIAIAEEMLIDNPADYERVQKETGLSLKTIYGIKGKLRKEGRLPIDKGVEKKEEGSSGAIAPEEQMYDEMRAVLEEELDITPGIGTGKVREYILNRFNSEAVYKTNPTELYFLIGKAGPKVEDYMIREIVTRVFNVTKNYNIDRMKLGAYMPRNFSSQLDMPFPFFDQGGMRGYNMPQGGYYYTREQVDELVRKEREQSKLDSLTDTVKKLAETVDRLSKGDYQKVGSGIIEETFTDPERGQVTRKILPSGQTSTLDEIVKLKQAGLLGKDIDLEDVRRVVKEEIPPPSGESPTVTEMKTRLFETEKKYEEIKNQMNQEDKKRMEDLIKDLRDEVRSRSSTGWTDDGMRVINEGFQAVARKEPVKLVVDFLGKSPTPKEKVVESTASGGLGGKLSEKFVAQS